MLIRYTSAVMVILRAGKKKKTFMTMKVAIYYAWSADDAKP
jgi:hypothetical protein